MLSTADDIGRYCLILDCDINSRMNTLHRDFLYIQVVVLKYSRLLKYEDSGSNPGR